MKAETVAFVPPRYGLGLVGGAETYTRMLAEELHRRGWPVEILTTCGVDAHSWSDTGDFRPGSEVVNGITVRRFMQTGRKYTRKVYRIERKILQRKKVPLKDQEYWIYNVVSCPDLCRYLQDNRDRYRAFVFIPYLFGTTYAGIKAVPEKAYIIPCLHDEPYAYLEAFRRMMHSVRGIMFNTPPEEELARRIYGPDLRGKVVGGVAVTPYHADGDRFRHKFSISGDIVLYAGRREIFKNTPLLVKYFCNYLENGGREARLVLVGAGSVEIPFSFRSHVIDLGVLSERDKRDAFAAASVFCNPSANESLSIVMMEAWMQEVPCLVHGDCAVTRYHVERSGGGLWFDDYPTFHEALETLLSDQGLRREMGRRGKEYVEANYNWDRIVQAFEEVLREGEASG
ncbi:MAG: glycosyltransferase family 4 protein [Candidatus Geothermincolales bacterium]